MEIFIKSSLLLNLIHVILQEARSNGGITDKVNSGCIYNIKQRETNYGKLLPGESNIQVDNLLKINTTNNTFCGPSDVWFTFDCLMGSHIDLPFTMRDYMKNKIAQIDKEIKFKETLLNMNTS